MSEGLSADLYAALETLIKAEIALLNAEAAVEEARQWRASADQGVSQFIDWAVESACDSSIIAEVDFYIRLGENHFHVRLNARPVQVGWDFDIWALTTPAEYLESPRTECCND